MVRRVGLQLLAVVGEYLEVNWNFLFDFGIFIFVFKQFLLKLS